MEIVLDKFRAEVPFEEVYDASPLGMNVMWSEIIAISIPLKSDRLAATDQLFLEDSYLISVLG
jgi:hypothetical protein